MFVLAIYNDSDAKYRIARSQTIFPKDGVIDREFDKRMQLIREMVGIRSEVIKERLPFRNKIKSDFNSLRNAALTLQEINVIQKDLKNLQRIQNGFTYQINQLNDSIQKVNKSLMKKKVVSSSIQK